VAAHPSLYTAPPARPWDKIHVFWGDERYVPPDHQIASADGSSCLLDRVDIPTENIHPMPTDEEPQLLPAVEEHLREFSRLRLEFPALI